MNKIAYLEILPWEKEILQQYPQYSEQIDLFSDKLTTNNAPKFKDYEIISTFIGSQLTAENLKLLPNLKYIATRSTGFDHIDLSYCRQHKILVSNVPTYGIHTVAEYTFALLLSLVRKIYQAYHQVRETGSFGLEGLRGQELFNKTIGVIGTGHIGVEVIKIAKGFSLKIIAYDKYPNQELAKELDFTYLPLESVLAQADIITFHVPYNKETHHLLNESNISLIKKGAYLINTSRGAIIETQALYKALKNKQIAGAALDVLEEEGDIKEEQKMLLENKNMASDQLKTLWANHLFIDMNNVIVTPHNAFNTKEALHNIEITTMENIQHYLKREPQNIIT